MPRTYRGLLVPENIPKGEILEVTTTDNMEGNSVGVFLVEFWDRGPRRAYFALGSGEYLGDSFIPETREEKYSSYEGVYLGEED